MAPTTAPYAATPATAAAAAATATATKAPRRSSGKQSHSRSYPRGVGLDFRKLGALTLLSYIDHHGASCLQYITDTVQSAHLCLIARVINRALLAFDNIFPFFNNRSH
jgi:hypothetical protein